MRLEPEKVKLRWGVGNTSTSSILLCSLYVIREFLSDDLLWSIIVLSWCSVNIVACRTWRGVGRDHHSVARQRSLCLSLGNYSKRSSVCWVDLLSSQTGSRALNTVLSQHYWFCALYTAECRSDIRWFECSDKAVRCQPVTWWYCCHVVFAFYPSSCTAVSAEQLPREVYRYSRLMPSINRCLRKLLVIKWYHHVWNDEVRWTTRQPHVSAGKNW